MRLSTIESQKARPPGRTLLLEPSVFADVWPEKPRSAICVGLRLKSQNECGKARVDAERIALEAHPRGGVNAVDAFNDALMRCVIAFCICDPNDIAKPSSLFPQPEDDVFDAFTPRGAQSIYQAIERYELETSSLAHEIDEDEIDKLVDALVADGLDHLPVAGQKLARRLLGYVHDQLRKAGALPDSS